MALFLHYYTNILEVHILVVALWTLIEQLAALFVFIPTGRRRSIIGSAQRNGKLGSIIGYHNLQPWWWQLYAQEHGHGNKRIGYNKQNSADSTEDCQEPFYLHSPSQGAPQHGGN